MKALRWHGAGDLRLDEVEPRPAPEGAATVEVAYCGICGSDLAEYRSGPVLIRMDAHPLTGQQPPITLGHEFCGRVVSVAPGVDLRIGLRVTADACWRCGKCEACRRGDYHICRYGGSIGLHSDGAFARRVTVPAYCLLPVPASIGDDVAALTEPMAVGLHALQRAGVRPGDQAAVFGFGPIGAAAAFCGRALGATATVVELNPERQAKADELGFSVVDPGPELPRRLRHAIGGGGADIAVEATGAPAALGEAIEATRRGGRIAIAALGNSPTPIDSKRLVLYERSLIGCLGYRHDLPRVLRMTENGQLDPSQLISDIVPLTGAAATIGALASEPGRKIKILVDPSSGTGTTND